MIAVAEMRLRYCLDTSTLIESWNRRYPKDVFPTFWQRMEEAIGDGLLFAPEIVMYELQAKDDALHEWTKNVDTDFFLPLSEEVQKEHKRIINTYPKLIDSTKNRSMADPWVIALAKVEGCPVVTEEQMGGETKPRIPNVCTNEGIGWLSTLDMLRALKWSFR